jgi:MFS family permease
MRSTIGERFIEGYVETMPDGISARESERAVRRVGFWSALVATASAIGYAIVQPLTSPLVEWRGMAAYASSFNPSSQLFFYFTIVLSIAFVVLMASVHYSMPQSRRLWTHLGILFSVIYATIISFNYMLQLIAVGPSIASGETEGLALFAPANPHGFFITSETLGYIFMILAMLFAAPAFGRSSLERWIRAMFVASFGIPAVIVLAGAVLGYALPSVGLVSTDAWEVLLAISTALLVVYFKRAPVAGR